MKEYKIINQIIKKTINNELKWFNIDGNTYYTRIKITNFKYIRIDLNNSFFKGHYYRTLTLRYFNGEFYKKMKILYQSKYTKIKKLDEIIKKK